ncbi:hypothetical protein CTI12_AA092060 [Artemisia annua]|uniref:Uncharacterized protein n=1 Tax=Artemisia annua TaxID=35608 RepID=A0A2U1PAL8_ARTAN|nr:hypothetical protein CTI12_AA092060 [Artemisia annua]
MVDDDLEMRDDPEFLAKIFQATEAAETSSSTQQQLFQPPPPPISYSPPRELSQRGDHAVHCSSEVGVKFRHNLVRDILVDICSKVGIMVRKEAPMGFLSDDG